MTEYPDKPVYIIDDEAFILQSLSAVLRTDGINNIVTCNDSRAVMDMISRRMPAIVLLDLTMPYVSGDVLLSQIKAACPEVPVLIITGINELSTAVDCMKKGASDYLVKAIENSKLISAVRTALSIDELKEENRLLKMSLLADDERTAPAFETFVAGSKAMHSVFKYLNVVSRTAQTVLIRGETGTGKELAAEAVHRASGRTGAFVSINAAGLDDTMFSDTLFGHRKGAYSGADDNRAGLIEKAADGTLFLDEIGDLPPASQIKLLRLLEKGEYYTLGSDVLKRSSCRIIAATNCDLEKQMEDGDFRKDLYYRLASHEITIPPLRDRQEDIPLLIHHYCNEISEELNVPAPEVSGEFIRILSCFELKGNVRELMTVLSRCISSCENGRLDSALLGRLYSGEISGAAPGSGKLPAESPADSAEQLSSREVPLFPEALPGLKQWADMLVDEAMKRSGGNITAAAAMLGISQPALSKRLSKR